MKQCQLILKKLKEIKSLSQDFDISLTGHAEDPGFVFRPRPEEEVREIANSLLGKRKQNPEQRLEIAIDEFLKTGWKINPKDWLKSSAYHVVIDEEAFMEAIPFRTLKDMLDKESDKDLAGTSLHESKMDSKIHIVLRKRQGSLDDHQK